MRVEEWLNSLIVIEKSKNMELQICLDPKPIKIVILREHFQLPMLEDIATHLSRATILSKLDANHGRCRLMLKATTS